MKPLDCIFFVFGSVAAPDMSNIKSIETYLIPNTDDVIVLDEGIFVVTGRCINYKNVEKYDADDSGRGGELLYVFLKKL